MQQQLIAQAGIFNPLFLAGPILLWIGVALLFGLPLWIYRQNRARRIREIEIRSEQDLARKLAELAAETHEKQ